MLGIAGGAFGIFIGLAVIAPRLVRPLAHLVGLPQPGSAARRPARAGERDSQPRPDGLDRGGADDRAHARLVRGRLRQGPARERREALREAARHEPRDHLAERLGHRPAWRRRSAAEAAGVSSASSIRGDQRQARRRRGGRQRRRPGDDRRAYNFEWVEGSPRRSRRSPGATPSSARARATSATRSSLLTPAGKRARAKVRGVYRKHGDLDQLLGQVVLSQATFDAGFPRPADLLTLVQADATARSSGRSTPTRTRSCRPATSSSRTGRHGSTT